jgi:uncharacterized membrane-anchored protein YjiN (DUF445 family)
MASFGGNDRGSYPGAPTLATADPAPGLARRNDPPRRNYLGNVSLGVAAVGAVAVELLRHTAVGAGWPWLVVLGGGFEAAVVGGLADWFAVTALFRHPLGIPIPHTAIIPMRRAKIVEGIVAMVEDEWLSPEVIGARLARFAPSGLVRDWLADPAHVERLAAPMRDLVRGMTRALASEEGIAVLVEQVRHQLRDAPLDGSLGRLLARLLANGGAESMFGTAAASLANVAEQPRTAVQLRWWLDRSATTLQRQGRRMLPFLLRRRVVQRALVDAACGYAGAELRGAATDPEHPLRHLALTALGRFSDRLHQAQPDTLDEIARWRTTLADALESEPLVRHLVVRLRSRVDRELLDADSRLSRFLRTELLDGVRALLDDPERCARFDAWVRTTVDDLLRRHHHQIGLTVRENLEALDTRRLVAQIEGRVGADLQYIRLNGAVVGGLIGVLIATARWCAG